MPVAARLALAATLLATLLRAASATPIMSAAYRSTTAAPPTPPPGYRWYDRAKVGLQLSFAPSSQWPAASAKRALVCAKPPSEAAPCILAGPSAALDTNITNAEELSKHRREYWRLSRTWEPSEFNATALVALAASIGAKYIVGTAVSEDGFALWPSKVSSYAVGLADAPKAPADMLAELSAAARASPNRPKFGVHYAKAHWGLPSYWRGFDFGRNESVPAAPATAFGEGANYMAPSEPDLWLAYVAYQQAQLSELSAEPYAIDLLRLGSKFVVGPALDTQVTDSIKKLRAARPNAMAMDEGGWGDFDAGDGRCALPEEGSHHLYLPQRKWECEHPIGKHSTYSASDVYKPARVLVHALVRTVARGGNHLLQLGLGPSGKVDEGAAEQLELLGRWMAVNSEAITSSSPVAPYSAFTQVAVDAAGKLEQQKFYLTERASYVYVAMLTESDALPMRVDMPFLRAPAFGGKVGVVDLLGVEQPLQFKELPDGGVVVTSPPRSQVRDLKYAYVFRLILN